MILDELETQYGGQARALADTVGGQQTQAWNALGDALEEVGAVIAKFIPPIAKAIKDAAEAFSSLSEPMQKFIVAVGGGLAVGGPVLIGLGLLVTAVGAISLPFVAAAAAVAALTAVAVKFWPQIKAGVQAVREFGTGALDWIKDKFDGLATALADLPAQFRQIGRDIIDGLLGGLREKWTAVKDGVTGLGTAMAGWFRRSVDSQSPSRVFAAIGRDVVAGLQQGIEAASGEVKGQVEGLGQSLSRSFADILVNGGSFKDKLRGLLATTASSVAGNLAQNGINAGFAALGVPGFASGTNFAPGGMALVGEQGPELVNLPRGSQVYDSARTAGMMGKGGAEIIVRTDPGVLVEIARGEAVRVARGTEDRAVSRSVQAVDGAMRRSGRFGGGRP